MKKESKKLLSIRVPIELKLKIDDAAKRMGLNQTEIIELALYEFFNTTERSNEEKLSVQRWICIST